MYTLTFIDDFSSVALAWLQFILDMLTGAFTGVVAIFYDDTLGFTIYGYLMLFGLAMTFVIMGLGFIQKLIKK